MGVVRGHLEALQSHRRPPARLSRRRPTPVRDEVDRTRLQLETASSLAGSQQDVYCIQHVSPTRRRIQRRTLGALALAVDQTLRCRECGVDFIWTEGEQQFFSSKGLTNPPSRCPSCRAARKAAGMGGGGYGGGGGGGGRSSGPRQMFEVTCAGCGGIARVPFQPRGDKPVYCSDCFRTSAR